MALCYLVKCSNLFSGLHFIICFLICDLLIVERKGCTFSLVLKVVLFDYANIKLHGKCNPSESETGFRTFDVLNIILTEQVFHQSLWNTNSLHVLSNSLQSVSNIYELLTNIKATMSVSNQGTFFFNFCNFNCIILTNYTFQFVTSNIDFWLYTRNLLTTSSLLLCVIHLRKLTFRHVFDSAGKWNTSLATFRTTFLMLYAT